MKLLASKTASVRLPKEMFEEIDSVCDNIGCTRNDWIKDTLQDKLREESNDETEIQVIKDTKPEPAKPKIITDATKPKASWKLYDDNGNLVSSSEDAKPKVTIELDPEPKKIDNSNKPRIEMNSFNGEYFPHAEVYEI